MVTIEVISEFGDIRGPKSQLKLVAFDEGEHYHKCEKKKQVLFCDQFWM